MSQTVLLTPDIESTVPPVLASALYWEDAAATSLGPTRSADLGVGTGKLWVIEDREVEPTTQSTSPSDCMCVLERTKKVSVSGAYRFDLSTTPLGMELASSSSNDDGIGGRVAQATVGISIPGNAKGVAFGMDPSAVPYMSVLQCKDAFSFQCKIDFFLHPMFDPPDGDSPDTVTVTSNANGDWKALTISRDVAGADNPEGIFVSVRVPKGAISMSRTTDEFKSELLVGFNGAANARVDTMTMINGDKDDMFYRMRVPVLSNKGFVVQANRVHFEYLGQSKLKYSTRCVVARTHPPPVSRDSHPWDCRFCFPAAGAF